MLPRPRPESLHQYRTIAARLNEAGASVRSRGMKFALLFHNHELMPQQGSSGFDELMKHTDAALVHLEVDVYWIAQAGLDPASFLERYKERVKLLHLKDRLAGFPTSYTPMPAPIIRLNWAKEPSPGRPCYGKPGSRVSSTHFSITTSRPVQFWTVLRKASPI